MKLGRDFYSKDALEVAPNLLGKILVRKFDDGTELRKMITEVEVYRGEEDLASHASKGKTARTQVMYGEAGHLYVYLIYGLFWLLNIVTGEKDRPQALLVRGLEGIEGPGRVGTALKLDKSFYGEDVTNSERIRIEDTTQKIEYKQTGRIGVEYAGEWAKKEWRFIKTSL